ncbi:efflux RND transporter periplasmic adaptor subunit [Schlegelella sp. S2-27]|uniref:Efflux RND transporter periplasmic adaptor subunit n=1 Tax=Caldimonas mangrovi TaxID=2944811 RepID=A0ABT0YMK4_9BURK|nr:efflux RND transporter periplasmic adaptor subunit [Caldimonas mangrovi]MCM5679594.1 efflux RND transporter periplasmic adaptor subunit [Caldimonas mangrovi]
MKKPRSIAAAVVVAVILAATAAWAVHASRRASAVAAVAVPKPALTVAAATLQSAVLPVRISANGNISAWQEASIGTEADGLRLAAVNVNVGDVVRRGQVLAAFASDTVNADLAQSRAAVAELEAALADAEDNARRAHGLQATGAMSAQQIQQYLTAERTARARLEAAQAAERTQQLRLAQTRVLAPDDGVISARSATVGAVLPAGQELFRLIRRGRLEWRAEVAASELAKLAPGQVARLTPAGGETIEGRLRVVSPAVDIQTRNGLVYVDLPPDTPARAGMFARGEFDIGTGRAMTLPQSAVLLRDGHAYVMRIGTDSKVMQTKVVAGRRAGDRIEITGGIDASARVVAAGGAFLGDGDLVRVVDDPVARSSGRLVSGAASAAVN